jgi:hypothetical protein
MHLLRLVLIAAIATALAQVYGCHYYVRATPTLIISDSPISLPAETP